MMRYVIAGIVIVSMVILLWPILVRMSKTLYKHFRRLG